MGGGGGWGRGPLAGSVVMGLDPSQGGRSVLMPKFPRHGRKWGLSGAHPPLVTIMTFMGTFVFVVPSHQNNINIQHYF